MTIEEVQQLERTGNINNLSSLIKLIGLYCTDYTKLYTDNLVCRLHLQSFKLLWVNLKKISPSIATKGNVIASAKKFKANPQNANFVDFIDTLKQESATSVKVTKKLSLIIDGIFITISQNITSLLNKTFGMYASNPISTELIADFVYNPSYESFLEMVNRIESFGKTHKELGLAKKLLLSIFSYIQDNEIEKFKDIKEQCYKIAQITDSLNEYSFILHLSKAKEGNVQAMLKTGQNYENGIGVEHNDNQAENWYTQALLSGEVHAQYFISNLNNKRNQKQIEEQYNRNILEQRTLFENIKQDFANEREKTRKLEKERLDETKRHNLEIEDLMRQLAEAEKTRTSIQSEEKDVRVLFSYTYVHHHGNDFHEHQKDTITTQTYNSLINGGESAISNYIRSNFCYLYEGDRIKNARMKKID